MRTAPFFSSKYRAAGVLAVLKTAKANVASNDVEQTVLEFSSRLGANKQRFICHAIEASRRHHVQDRVTAKMLIEDMLGEHPTLSQWMYNNGLPPGMFRQKYRHMWLDRIISDLEAAINESQE